MANEDEGSKDGQKPPEGKRRFSQQQYDLLKRCSDNKDLTEWNQWRKEHPDEDILLEGQDFTGWYLKGAYLHKGGLVDINSLNVQIFNGDVFLKGTNFFEALLEQSKLIDSHLEGASFIQAHLQGADFQGAHLKNSNFNKAHIEGADFNGADLKGADFSLAIVNGGTLIWKCEVDSDTKFEGVGLDFARTYPKLKQLLEYNIRRMNWEEFYRWKDWYTYRPEKERKKLHQFILRNTIGCFWWMSDYGISTKRIIVAFFVLTFLFANIYYHWARVAPPGIVENLFVDRNGIPVEWWIAPLRTLYFSIVTMTTLGFGDMYSNAHSIFGHILLSLQVILGDVLLGALVTRFAVLFTAGGPAGKFSPTKTKEKAEVQ